MSEDTFQVNDRRLPPFLWIDSEIPRRYARKLGPAPLALYTILASYSNDSRQCWPSLRRLANDLSVDLKTVRVYKERLEHFGLIHVQAREYRRNGKRWTGHLFTLLDMRRQPAERYGISH